MRCHGWTAAVLTALAVVPACSASNKRSLSLFGDWIASDAKALATDVKSAPGWLSGHTDRQVKDMGGSLSWFAGEIREDSKTTSEMVTGFPDWASKQLSTDAKNLNRTLAIGGSWIGSDAQRFVNEDIVGAPAYIKRHVDSQMRDMAGSVNEFGDMIRTDATSFWDRVAVFLEMMLFL
jgi:hypothetical protein